ncbi:MAG: hypothetical protein ABL940_00280 [Bacteroidia bacterium]
MKTYILSLAVVLTIVSCKKKEAETATPTPVVVSTPVVTPVATAGFKWTENGGAEITADSSRFTAQYSTLIAFKGGSVKFEINLTAGTVATYTIGTNNVLTLVGGGANHVATGGSVVVTANASSKMSGTFDVTMNTGGFTNVKGAFTDVVIK